MPAYEAFADFLEVKEMEMPTGLLDVIAVRQHAPGLSHFWGTFLLRSASHKLHMQAINVCQDGTSAPGIPSALHRLGGAV